MKTLSFACPYCAQMLSVEPQPYDFCVTCPKCGGDLTVPGVVTSSVEPRSPSGSARTRNPLLIPLLLVSTLLVLATVILAVWEYGRYFRVVDELRGPVHSTGVKASPVLAEQPPLVLEGWDYKFEEGDGRDDYEITLRLRNTGNKDIKLLQAGVFFSDLLGEKLLAIKVNPDLYIRAGEGMTERGVYDANRFIAEEMRMRNMQKANVRAALKVNALVFSDGSRSDY